MVLSEKSLMRGTAKGPEGGNPFGSLFWGENLMSYLSKVQGNVGVQSKDKGTAVLRERVYTKRTSYCVEQGGGDVPFAKKGKGRGM